MDHPRPAGAAGGRAGARRRPRRRPGEPGIRYGPPVPAWNIVVGAAYAYDRRARGQDPGHHEDGHARDRARGGRGTIRGTVRDATTRKPLAGDRRQVYQSAGGRAAVDRRRHVRLVRLCAGAGHHRGHARECYVSIKYILISIFSKGLLTLDPIVGR